MESTKVESKTASELPAVAPVTVTFELKDIYRSAYGDGDYTRLPAMLLDSLAAAMVRRIAEDRSGYTSLLTAINKVRDEVIREMVTPIVAEAFASPILRTNSYGEPIRGETTTLREIIIAESIKVITGPADSYGSRGETRLQAVIRKEIESTWEREIKGAIDAAKAEVRKAVQDKAAGILAQTIQSMAVSS